MSSEEKLKEAQDTILKGAQKVFERFKVSFDDVMKGIPTPSYLKDRDDCIHALLLAGPILFAERERLLKEVDELKSKLVKG